MPRLRVELYGRLKDAGLGDAVEIDAVIRGEDLQPMEGRDNGQEGSTTDLTVAPPDRATPDQNGEPAPQ